MVVVIAQAQRNAGTYRTASAPTDVLPNGTITAALILNLADMQDPALAMLFGMEANDTAGAAANDPGWYTFGQVDWFGNATGYNPKFPGVWLPPSVSWSTSALTALSMRATLTLNKRTPVGLDILIADPSIRGIVAEPDAGLEKLAYRWRTWRRAK